MARRKGYYFFISFLLVGLLVYCGLIFIGDKTSEPLTVTITHEYRRMNKSSKISFETTKGENFISNNSCFKQTRYSKGSTHQIYRVNTFINGTKIHSYYACT